MDETEWAAFVTGFERLIEQPGTPPLCKVAEDHPEPPHIDDEYISFNGVGDDGHENMVVNRTPERDFEFCKTAHKPYDYLVTAVMSYLAAIGVANVSSDGDLPDWQKGISAARQAWPDANIPDDPLAGEDDDED